MIVRSREEVDAQVAAYPAALFVDPLTGPITRTALQSLRTAALNSRVPVLVTMRPRPGHPGRRVRRGPAVLLRALARGTARTMPPGCCWWRATRTSPPP